MVYLARPSQKRGGPGFTLLELLLVVVLMLGLLSALVYNFNAAQTGANLNEGGRQFEALIRFAGAHAASIGRPVQFRFDEASTNELEFSGPQIRVVSEIDPLGQPGIFEDVREAQPFLAELLERIRIVDIKGGERPANQGTNEMNEAEMTTTLPPITFYPDGSSDSAMILIQSRDQEDLRQLKIHLAGVTGSIRTEIQTFEEMTPIEWMDDEELEKSAAPATQTATPAPRQNEFETTSTNDFFFDDELP